MGIQGLLPFLKKASRGASIKEFKGCTVAIDSYCWLHKGAFACAKDLILQRKTDQYVFYCMKYLNNLLSFGIKPIMVFDGCHLPSKKNVEEERRKRRKENKLLAKSLLQAGRDSEARDAMVKAIDVTPEMALNLMIASREKGIDCIVAPYEADAQLAYLARKGIADLIITEDSDLILFGCERVMYKMDFNGNGMLIESKYLNEALQLGDRYTFDKFRYMCILSGCDYHPSLPGIGLGKALKVFKLTRQPDLKVVLKKMPTILNMSSLHVPPDYIDGFFKALNTFMYQLVFDPITRNIVPLNEYEGDIDPTDLYYAGPLMDRQLAYQIALGNINVNNKEVIHDFDPDTFKPKYKKTPANEDRNKVDSLSIWNKNYRPSRRKIPTEQNLQVESKRTTGKEILVSLPSNVQTKRKRVEEPKNDDEELQFYKTEAPQKKSRLEMELDEDVSDTKSILNKFSFTRSNEESCESNTPAPDLALRPVRTPTNINEQVKVNCEEYTSPEPSVNTEDSKNSAVKFNKFRVADSPKTKTFSLDRSSNAKQVLSRHFEHKKPLKKSDFGSKFETIVDGFMKSEPDSPEKNARLSETPQDIDADEMTSQLGGTKMTQSRNVFHTSSLKTENSMDATSKTSCDNDVSLPITSAARGQFKPLLPPTPDCDNPDAAGSLCPETSENEPQCTTDSKEYKNEISGGPLFQMKPTMSAQLLPMCPLQLYEKGSPEEHIDTAIDSKPVISTTRKSPLSRSSKGKSSQAAISCFFGPRSKPVDSATNSLTQETNRKTISPNRTEKLSSIKENFRKKPSSKTLQTGIRLGLSKRPMAKASADDDSTISKYFSSSKSTQEPSVPKKPLSPSRSNVCNPQDHPDKGDIDT